VTGIITLDPKHLHAALGRVTSSIDRNKKYPILGCVRLAASDGTLELTGSDMGAKIVVRIPAEGTCAPICIDYQRLGTLIGTIKDRGELSIEVEAAGRATIKCGRSRFTVGTMDASSFPDIGADSLPYSFQTSGPELARLMTALEPAINREVSRHYLCGIHIVAGSITDTKAAGLVTGVATDAHKLYARHITAQNMSTDAPSVIVPRASCARIAKLFGEAASIQVGYSDRKFAISFGDTDYLTLLIEGTYPDWRRILPKQEPAFSYDVPALKLAAQAVQASKRAEKAGKAIKLTFGVDETTLTAIDLDDPTFTGTDVCLHSTIGSSELESVGINVDYLIEMLDHLDAETVEIGPPRNPEKEGILLRGATLDDRIIVIMATRV